MCKERERERVLRVFWGEENGGLTNNGGGKSSAISFVCGDEIACGWGHGMTVDLATSLFFYFFKVRFSIFGQLGAA